MQKKETERKKEKSTKSIHSMVPIVLLGFGKPTGDLFSTLIATEEVIYNDIKYQAAQVCVPFEITVLQVWSGDPKHGPFTILAVGY